MTEHNKTETSASQAENKAHSEKGARLYRKLASWLSPLLLIALVYFGNVELQSYLGRQALKEVRLQALPLDDAMRKAQRENKYILANMSAIWCSSCRKLDRHVFANKSVEELINTHFIFVRIEYESEEGEAFMKKYNVRGFPSVLVLKSNGDMIKKMGLTYEPLSYIQDLQAVL